MANGENIFKRKDGRWEARYIRGYELSGPSTHRVPAHHSDRRPVH